MSFKFHLSLCLEVEDKADDIGFYHISSNDSEVKFTLHVSAIDAFVVETHLCSMRARKCKAWGGFSFPQFISKNELAEKAVDESESYSVLFIFNFTIYLDSVSELHKDEKTVVGNQTRVSLSQSRVSSPLAYGGGITLSSFKYYLTRKNNLWM